MQTTNTTTAQSNTDRLEKRDATLEVGLIDIDIDIVTVGRKSDRVV
jgi:hypothetical protein